MSDTKPPPNAPGAPVPGHTSSIADQIRLREQKAETLRARGGHPYGSGVAVTVQTSELHRRHGAHDAPALEANRTETYGVAGRVMLVRNLGKMMFVTLRDRDGDIQLFVRKNIVGDAAYEELKLLDIGDHVCAWGRALRTKTGELSIAAGELGTTPAPAVQGQPARPGIQLLCKALRPLPEKWHGLTDVETRYRQRYVDLAINLDVRAVFKKRAKMITGLRAFFDKRDYVEVETPILHKPEEAGGAAARPFSTHHNALDLDLKLRIATELHLKRLIVGGLERVYEIGRIFRNEGIDRRHNPEFTSVEFYQAYATYTDLMALTEQLVSELALAVAGKTVLPYQGTEIDYAAPWERVSMVGKLVEHLSKTHDAFKELIGPSASVSRQLDALERFDFENEIAKTDKEALRKFRLATSPGARVAWAFEYLCEADLPKDRPCFVIDFPLEVSPLARKRDSEPRLVDRFEAYAGGMEIANAFSELNDPRDQESRFRAQVEAARAGDAEAMPYDRDFVRALEHGMPPTAGEGIGIDRLAMLFCDAASIRDVVLFPLLKPQAEEWDAPAEGAPESGKGA